jgi:glutamate-ammonia-ligase adenylyltransferase
MAVLGLGKLGAEEMTFQSDLDLIFIYECAGESSAGPRPLSPTQYFARLGQRYINAISAMTAEGRLFEVDMRLRPSGHAGPIAVAIETFLDYQKSKAWTWEHMALTRARPIVGNDGLTARVDAAIGEILGLPRAPQVLLSHVADMRERLDTEFGTDDIWNVKFVRGGLLDIEFLIQYGALKAASAGLLRPPPRLADALGTLIEAGIFDEADGQALADALAFEQTVQSVLRLCSTGGFNEATAGEALQNSLARHCGEDSFTALRERLQRVEETVLALYEKRIAGPYRALPAGARAEGRSS